MSIRIAGSHRRACMWLHRHEQDQRMRRNPPARRRPLGQLSVRDDTDAGLVERKQAGTASAAARPNMAMARCQMDITPLKVPGKLILERESRIYTP
jgi:hypothetical protein